MDGYRQDSFDPDAGVTTNNANKGSWWKILLFTIGYMVPLLWLWNRTDFPDSFGIHITAHGKAGLAETYYYSYLLLHRHSFLDVVTFIYMWAIVVGVIVWVANKPVRKAIGRLRKTGFSLYADPE